MLISFSCNLTATKQRKKYNGRKIAMPPSTYKFTILLVLLKVKQKFLRPLSGALISKRLPHSICPYLISLTDLPL